MPKKTYKLLDLCCCAGGAAMGYHQSGFKVTGVDIKKQPNYPFKMVVADAVAYLRKHGHKYDAFHASPPCQKWSCSTSLAQSKGKEYPDIIAPIRDELEKLGKPYIIENVMQAPIRPDIVLCGYMFGLKVIRNRKFELGNWFCLQPGFPVRKGSAIDGDFVSVFGKASWNQNKAQKERGTECKFKKGTILETWKYAMGIDWKITDIEISESIPPAYSKYLGEQLIQYMKNQ